MSDIKKLKDDVKFLASSHEYAVRDEVNAERDLRDRKHATAVAASRLDEAMRALFARLPEEESPT